jgi:chromosome segregation ATPase
MPSRNKRRGTPPVRPAKPAGAAPARAAKPSDAAVKLVETAEALETGDEPIQESEVTGEVSTSQLRRAIARAESAHRHAEQRVATYDRKVEELSKAMDKLAQERTELHERQTAADEEHRRLAEGQAQLLSLEEEAKRDFAGYRQQQLDLLRAELGERRTTFDRQLHDVETDHNTRYTQREKVLVDRAAELDQQEERLREEESRQRRLERRLNARQENLDQDVDDRIREQMARMETELELARRHASNYQQQLEAMRDLAERRAAEVAEYNAANVELGHSIPDAAAELRRLRTENRELRAAATANPVATGEQLAELEARLHDLQIEREEWLRENAELRRHVTATTISTTERQNAAMVNEALRRQNNVLTTELDQQSARLQQMQGMIKDSPPFPACAAMDGNPDYQLQPDLDDEPVRLRDFVARVRGRMVLDLGLYYSAADLRCFVAGLASSRLHLLQGISGIGKTRLPEAFAQIIGAVDVKPDDTRHAALLACGC